jgi:hypothetical protein
MYDHQKSEWVSVNIPFTQNWSKSDTFYYARVYLTCVQKGIDEKQAHILAEAAVFKRLFPGVLYSKQIEEQLIF